VLRGLGFKSCVCHYCVIFFFILQGCLTMRHDNINIVEYEVSCNTNWSIGCAFGW